MTRDYKPRVKELRTPGRAAAERRQQFESGDPCWFLEMDADYRDNYFVCGFFGLFAKYRIQADITNITDKSGETSPDKSGAGTQQSPQKSKNLKLSQGLKCRSLILHHFA